MWPYGSISAFNEFSTFPCWQLLPYASAQLFNVNVQPVIGISHVSRLVCDNTQSGLINLWGPRSKLYWRATTTAPASTISHCGARPLRWLLFPHFLPVAVSQALTYTPTTPWVSAAGLPLISIVSDDRWPMEFRSIYRNFRTLGTTARKKLREMYSDNRGAAPWGLQAGHVKFVCGILVYQ